MHGAILPYDVIVREKQPVDPDSNYTHITLSNVSYDFAASGKLAALSEKYERVLVVIETIPAMYLLPWLNTLGDHATVSVLAVNAGIGGCMNKAKADMTDIGTLIGTVNIKEVYDKDSLM